MMRGRTLVGLAAAAALFSTAPAASAQLDLRSCKHRQCGRISVPLDRTGATRARSRSTWSASARGAPAAGTTLLLAGGPGQPATFAYDNGTRTPTASSAASRRTNDIVAFDGRGTGVGLLRCPELERANLVDAGAAAAPAPTSSAPSAASTARATRSTTSRPCGRRSAWTS